MEHKEFTNEIDEILSKVENGKVKKKKEEEYCIETLKNYLYSAEDKKGFMKRIIQLMGDKNKKPRKIAADVLKGWKTHTFYLFIKAPDKPYLDKIQHMISSFKHPNPSIDLKSYYEEGDIVDRDILRTKESWMASEGNVFVFAFNVGYAKDMEQNDTSRVIRFDEDLENPAALKEGFEKRFDELVQQFLHSLLEGDEFVDALLQASSKKIYPEIAEYLNIYYHYQMDKESLKSKVISLLDDENDNLRELAVSLLLNWHLPNNKQLLQDLANDKNKKIKKMVSDFLETIDMVFDLTSKEELDEMIENDTKYDRRGKKLDLAIHEAAKRGDLTGVKYLQKNGYKLSDNGEEKKRAIHCAVESGNTELVRFLLQKKSKADQADAMHRTPLHYVSRDTSVEMVRLLEENGADLNAVSDEKDTLFINERHQLSVLFHVLWKGNKDVIDYFIQKGIRLSDTDDIRYLLNNCNTENLVSLITYLKSCGHSPAEIFQQLRLSQDLEDNNGLRAKILYEKLDTLTLTYDDKIEILMNGDLEFIKLLLSRGLDLSDKLPAGTYLDVYTYDVPTPYVFLAYRNEHEDVRKFILKNKNIDLGVSSGDKEDFHFEYFEAEQEPFYISSVGKKDEYVLRKSYTSLLALATEHDRKDDVKFLLENGIEKVSDIMIAVALDANQRMGYRILEYFAEKHFDDFNPFRVATKKVDETLLSIIIKAYSGENKDQLLKNLSRNGRIKAYAQDKGLDQDNIEEISNAYLSNLQKELQKQVEAEMENVESIETVYKFLESGMPDKVRAALDVLKKNEDFYQKAEKRYLNLIKANLNDKNATLENFEEGIFNKKQIRELETAGIYSKGLDFRVSYALKELVDFIGSVTMNHVDVDKFIAKAKKISTDVEAVDDLALDYEEKFFDDIEKESEIYPDGWYSQSLKKLLNLKGKIENLLFEKCNFIQSDFMFPEAFFFFVRMAAGPYGVSLSLFQSQMELSDTFWLCSGLHQENFEIDEESDLSVPPEPFEYH